LGATSLGFAPFSLDPGLKGKDLQTQKESLEEIRSSTVSRLESVCEIFIRHFQRLLIQLHRSGLSGDLIFTKILSGGRLLDNGMIPIAAAT